MRPLALLVAVLALSLAACRDKAPPAATAPSPAPPLPTAAEVDPTATADERRCTADADCTLSTLDCCGCAALGKQIGVRKDRVQALTERRRPICGVVACAQGMSEDPSCSATRAVCREGQCVPDVASGPKGGAGVDVEKIKD